MVIKITIRNQKRKIITSRSWFRGDIFNKSYVKLFGEDKPSSRQLENSSKQLKIQDGRLLDMFLLQHKCGRCLHRPPLAALAVDQLTQGGNATHTMPRSKMRLCKNPHKHSHFGTESPILFFVFIQSRYFYIVY